MALYKSDYYYYYYYYVTISSTSCASHLDTTGQVVWCRAKWNKKPQLPIYQFYYENRTTEWILSCRQ